MPVWWWRLGLWTPLAVIPLVSGIFNGWHLALIGVVVELVVIAPFWIARWRRTRRASGDIP